jgi:hypothetical protein
LYDPGATEPLVIQQAMDVVNHFSFLAARPDFISWRLVFLRAGQYFSGYECALSFSFGFLLTQPNDDPTRKLVDLVHSFHLSRLLFDVFLVDTNCVDPYW